jgi:hypothetical protein
MLVHLIASADGLKENIEDLRTIISKVRENGHELARDWVEAAYTDVISGTAPESDEVWQKIIQNNLEAIARSDVVIAEISQESTAIGYQIAVALHQKKPVLLVVREGGRVSPFAWNIPSSFLKKVEYNSQNVVQIVDSFIKDNDIGTKDMRFNFFIDRAIYNYLRWAALKTGKTKAEVLRELVQREINDKEDL